MAVTPHGPVGGIALTLYLAVVSLVFSFFGGMILGLLCVSRNRFIRYPILAVVNAIRGVPLLMVIFWMYFLLPFLLRAPGAGKLDRYSGFEHFYIGLHVPNCGSGY